jgi:type I restriction-modification system DNA methylase subunit
MFRWNKAKPKKKKTAHVRKEPPKPYTPPDIPKFTKQSEKAKPKEEKRVSPEKAFMDTFRQLTSCHRSIDIWRDFVVMSACSISNAVDKAESHYTKREERYMRIIKKYRPEEQKLFPELLAHFVMVMEENPEQDFLGKLYMTLGLYDSHSGQVFTPYHVCQMMADISMGDTLKEEIDRKGYVTISDPCCGAGATLIAGAHAAKKLMEKEHLNFQNHVLVSAQDIDELVALMSYLQISLLGVAGYVKVGNISQFEFLKTQSK